jgi:hypothetical protein
MRRRAVGVVSMALVFGTAVPAGAAGSPAVVYSTDTGTKVASADGVVLSEYGPFQFSSLDGNVIAGSRHTPRSEAVVAFNATTGERLYRIRDAFAPVVLANGRKVGFMPDRFGRRDRFFQSVWIRTPRGRLRAVVRFAGRHRTVNARDFDGDGIPLDQAWDAAGRTLALTYGNDVDLFEYDVWVVDVRTREATRVTRGRVSRFPSLSPSGDRLALVREVDRCGQLRRAGDLVVMNADGTDRRTLLPGTCGLYYTDPRWISEDELIALRLDRVAPGQYDQDLVRVDAATGVATDLVTAGDIVFYTASARQQSIAYVRGSETTGFWIYDLSDGSTTHVAEGYIPNLAGTHRLV